MANEKLASILQWTDEVREQEPLKWERMPEIDLYMDQVITYMEKQLAVYCRNEESKLLTPSMINNYVKESLLPRPEKKKYNRDHLAALTMICLLKSELAIPDISQLRTFALETSSEQELYDGFIAAQNAALQQVAEQLREADSEEALRSLALTLALEANARRIAAEKILETLGEKNAEPEKEKKEKKKERDSKNDTNE